MAKETTLQTRQQIIEFKQIGLSISRIAERLGLSPSCVKKFCRCSQLAGKVLDSEVQIVTGDLRAWSRCAAANLVTMCDRRRGTKCHRLTLTSDI